MASVSQITIPRIALESRILCSQVKIKMESGNQEGSRHARTYKLAGTFFTSMKIITKFSRFWTHFDWEF